MTAEDRSTAHLFGSVGPHFCATKGCWRQTWGELCEECEEESMNPLVFHDDLDAQMEANSFLESQSKKHANLPGLEIRHDNFDRSEDCTSTLWAQGQLKAIAVRVRNDWNRTVLTVWPSPN